MGHVVILNDCKWLLLDAHVMRGFLDLSDNRLAVVLERAGDHHEAGEDQVTLQSLTIHLSYLNRDVQVKHILLFLSDTQHEDRKLGFIWKDTEYLLMTQVSHLFVSQR